MMRQVVGDTEEVGEFDLGGILMENPKNPISNVGQGMNSVKEAFDEVNSYAER